MIAMHTLDRTRPIIAAQAVGIAQGAIDTAAGYMKDSRPWAAHRRIPGASVHAGRHGHADRGGPDAHLPSVRPHRRGRPPRRAEFDRRHGQVLRVRRRYAGDGGRGAASGAMATRRISRSRDTCATPRSPKSTKAQTRSNAWSSPGTSWAKQEPGGVMPNTFANPGEGVSTRVRSKASILVGSPHDHPVVGLPASLTPALATTASHSAWWPPALWPSPG